MVVLAPGMTSQRIFPGVFEAFHLVPGSPIRHGGRGPSNDPANNFPTVQSLFRASFLVLGLFPKQVRRLIHGSTTCHGTKWRNILHER